MLYLGHRDVRSGVPPPGHMVHLRAELGALCCAMCEVLLAPTVSHSRHVLTAAGRRQHDKVTAVTRRLHVRITLSAAALSAAARQSGCVELSRISEYQRNLWSSWHVLHFIKTYRTPQSTRAYAHVTLWACPFVMGPYSAWVAQQTNLAFAVALAVLTAVGLSALINARFILEDPFVPGMMDTIKVAKEFKILKTQLQEIAEADGETVVGSDGEAVAGHNDMPAEAAARRDDDEESCEALRIDP